MNLQLNGDAPQGTYMLAVAANRRAFAGGMHSGTGGAKTASLFEGGAERSETEGVMRLRRMRNAETAFPTRCAAIRRRRIVGAIIDRPSIDLRFYGDAP